MRKEDFETIRELAAKRKLIDERIETLMSQLSKLPIQKALSGSYHKKSLGLVAWVIFIICFLVFGSIITKAYPRVRINYYKAKYGAAPIGYHTISPIITYGVGLIPSAIVVFIVKLIANATAAAKDRNAADYNRTANVIRDAAVNSNKQIEAEFDLLMKQKDQLFAKLKTIAPDYYPSYLFPEVAQYVFNYLNANQSATLDDAFLSYELKSAN